MQKNKWGMFKKLYIKEMGEIKQELLAIIVFGLIVNIAFMIWPQSPIIFLLLNIALMSSGIVPVISSVRSLTRDWNNNTIYLLMSLPVKGVIVLSAKLIALFSEFFLGTLAVSALLILNIMAQFAAENPVSISIAWNEIVTQVGTANIVLSIKFAFSLYLTILACFIYLVTMVFLSQMIARIKGKFMKIVSYVSFGVLVYVGGKIGNWVISNLPWTQRLQYITPDQIPSNISSIFISTMFMLLVLSALMLIGAGAIYDSKVEL